MTKITNDLSFWTYWVDSYLHTAQILFNELKNKWTNLVYTSYEPIGENDFKEYTKFDLRNTYLPVMFIFLHWLELVIKAILYKQNCKKISGHKLTALFQKLSNKNINSNYITLKNILEKYIFYSWDNWYFKKIEEVWIDLWYEALKYPTKNNWAYQIIKPGLLDFDNTWYKKIIEFSSKEIINDIEKIKSYTVEYIRN